MIELSELRGKLRQRRITWSAKLLVRFLRTSELQTLLTKISNLKSAICNLQCTISRLTWL